MTAKLTSNGKNTLVLAAVALVLGIPSAALVAEDASTEGNLLLVLRVLGRLSFGIFLLIVIIRPLRQLVRTPLTGWLLRNRRYVGLALAAAMTVHLGFIAWRFGVVREENLDLASWLTGGLFYGMLYLMLITSFNGPAARLGPGRWRTLHKTGFWVLAIFFGFTFRNDVAKIPDEPIYLALAVLTLLAAGVRTAAFFKGRSA